MSGTFSSRTYNFNTLLGRSSFPDYPAKKVVVPRFQRGYSWKKIHVATFWEDVITFHSQTDNAPDSQTYFLGPIVILPEKTHISLLDGQQRLATATILLSCIRDIAREKGGQKGADLARDIHRDLILLEEDKEEYALNLSELDQSFFRSYIQSDPSDSTAKPKLRSHRLIREAREYLREMVKQQIRGLAPIQRVTRLRSLRTTIAGKLKLVTIEVNSEEEAYQIFETLNDRGLRLSVPDLLLNFLMKSAAHDKERDQIREHWNNILERIGTRRVSVFLRHMWVSQFGDVKSQTLYREIRDHINTHSLSSVDFAASSAQECDSYMNILNISDGVPNGSQPYLEALMNRLSAERALPVLLSGIQCLKDNDFERLARSVVALVVRHSVIANLNPADLETTLYAAAREIRSLYRSKKSSSAILMEARARLQSIDPTKQQLAEGITELYVDKPTAQSLLHEIAAKMQSSTKAVTLGKTSIEHIFPRKADKAHWPNAAKLDPYVWHIGNLSLLEPKQNKDVGNKSFADKLRKYPKSEIRMTQQVVDKFKTWDEKAITERAQSMLVYISQIWTV